MAGEVAGEGAGEGAGGGGWEGCSIRLTLQL